MWLHGTSPKIHIQSISEVIWTIFQPKTGNGVQMVKFTLLAKHDISEQFSRCWYKYFLPAYRSLKNTPFKKIIRQIYLKKNFLEPNQEKIEKFCQTIIFKRPTKKNFFGPRFLKKWTIYVFWERFHVATFLNRPLSRYQSFATY